MSQVHPDLHDAELVQKIHEAVDDIREPVIKIRTKCSECIVWNSLALIIGQLRKYAVVIVVPHRRPKQFPDSVDFIRIRIANWFPNVTQYCLRGPLRLPLHRKYDPLVEGVVRIAEDNVIDAYLDLDELFNNYLPVLQHPCSVVFILYNAFVDLGKLLPEIRMREMKAIIIEDDAGILCTLRNMDEPEGSILLSCIKPYLI